MGLTKAFFSAPVIVPVTFRVTVESDGKIETRDFQVVLRMKRETAGQVNALSRVASLFDDGDNLDRFCRQLATEPDGIDDFPKAPEDERPLEIRAREYFAGDAYTALVQYVVMEVEKAQKPLEFFRGF